MKVPFVDLKKQYESIKGEINEAIQAVLDSSTFSGGPFVERFENEFAEFCQSKYCVGVGNGTEALGLILLALGIGDGDEVITVSNTFIATVEAISFCGAKPIFVDIDDNTYTMNPSLIEAAITSSTKAIVPVHLFGQTANMDPILDVARRHGLYVIEDACQAHGALYKDRKAGSLGDAAAFSFYPSKNLGAYGEAGAVVTNDEEIYRKVKLLRDHGQATKYYHDVIGWNSRMDGIQGAVLSVKLRHLDSWNRARQITASKYKEVLSAIEGIILPQELPHANHIYHVYAVRVSNRDRIIRGLNDKNVHCGIHYPVPVHQQKAYRDLSVSKEQCLIITEKCASELISLPMYPELEDEKIMYTYSCIKELISDCQLPMKF